MRGTCPVCRQPAEIETLADWWRFCPTCGFAHRRDASGRVVELSTTNHSRAFEQFLEAEEVRLRASGGAEQKDVQ